MEEANQPTIQQPDEQIPPQIRPSKKHWIKKIVPALIVLILLGIVGYAGYVYGTKSTESEPSSSSNSDTSGSQSDTATSSYHTVLYGSTERDPKIAIRLAIPQDYQAIAYANGPESFRSLFGDDKGSSIYDSGEWVLGDPENGDGNWSGNIGVMGIGDDWYTRDGYASYGGFNSDSYASIPENLTINGYDFSSPEKKNESLQRLIDDTSACAQDSSKGFSMSDVFNVCYKPILIRQAFAAYDPVLELSGYAKIKDVSYVLFGTVVIRGGLDGYSDDDLNKAGDKFIAGEIPGPTQKNIDSFVDAMKNSSVVFK